MSCRALSLLQALISRGDNTGSYFVAWWSLWEHDGGLCLLRGLHSFQLKFSPMLVQRAMTLSREGTSSCQTALPPPLATSHRQGTRASRPSLIPQTATPDRVYNRVQVPLHVRPGALHVRRGALHDTCAAVPFTRAPRCPSRGTCTRLYTVHSSQRRNPQQFRTLSELTQEPSAPSPPLVWPGRLVTPASCHSARSAPPPAVTRGRFSTPSQPSRRKPNQSQLSPQPSRRNPNHIRSA